MQLAFFLEEMQNIMLSAELFVPGVPLQQGCQGSLGRNLATKAGGVLQLGPDTNCVTQERTGCYIGCGHSYWIMSICPAGELS